MTKDSREHIEFGNDRRAPVSICAARIRQHCNIILNPKAIVNHRAFAGRRGTRSWEYTVWSRVIRSFGLYPLNGRRFAATVTKLTVFPTRFIFKPPARDGKQNDLYRMQDLCSGFFVLRIRLLLLSRKVFFRE